jgi:hypothetical protein
MSTLAQAICVTSSASAIAFHCSFNNLYALMTTSGKSASRIQTYLRLPARLTLYSRAPSFSRRSRMPRNVRRESGHMPASDFSAFSSTPLVHPRTGLHAPSQRARRSPRARCNCHRTIVSPRGTGRAMAAAAFVPARARQLHRTPAPCYLPQTASGEPLSCMRALPRPCTSEHFSVTQRGLPRGDAQDFRAPHQYSSVAVPRA